MSGKVAIVTGASSGIGAATALAIAGQCDGLVLHAHKSREGLERVAALASEQGAKTRIVLGDLADPSLGAALTGAALESFGRLDWLVANAGFPILKGFTEGTDADLDRAFRGNAMSLFGLARAAEDALIRSTSGRIVAIGSFTSHLYRTDMRQFPMSSASKAAVEAGVKSLAMHFAPHGVTVNCVVPGLIAKDAGTADAIPDTEMLAANSRIPLGRPGHPAEVAAAVTFLLSGPAGYITGQSLHVNGGLVI